MNLITPIKDGFPGNFFNSVSQHKTDNPRFKPLGKLSSFAYQLPGDRGSLAVGNFDKDGHSPVILHRASAEDR